MLIRKGRWVSRVGVCHALGLLDGQSFSQAWLFIHTKDHRALLAPGTSTKGRKRVVRLDREGPSSASTLKAPQQADRRRGRRRPGLMDASAPGAASAVAGRRDDGRARPVVYSSSVPPPPLGSSTTSPPRAFTSVDGIALDRGGRDGPSSLRDKSATNSAPARNPCPDLIKMPPHQYRPPSVARRLDTASRVGVAFVGFTVVEPSSHDERASPRAASRRTVCGARPRSADGRPAPAHGPAPRL